MGELKLRKGTVKHIEQELAGYHETKREIERLKANILHASPAPNRTGGGRSNLPGDPTGNTATLMLSHRRIEQLQWVVDAIDEVYNKLPEEKQKLIELRYWDGLAWDYIAYELNISTSTPYLWRSEILFALANQLGWR